MEDTGERRRRRGRERMTRRGQEECLHQPADVVVEGAAGSDQRLLMRHGSMSKTKGH